MSARAHRRLLLPSLVDDHLHVFFDAPQPGYLVRDLRRVIREHRPDLELKAPSVEPVETRAYQQSTIRYLLRQPKSHGLPGHPALWTGSGFQDLVGARLLPGFERARLRDLLPRLKLRDLFPLVDLDPERLTEAPDDRLRALGSARLVELAAGVFAVGPDLSTSWRTQGVLEARSLAAHVGLRVGASVDELAHYLQVRRRAVRRLANRPTTTEAVRALRLRAELEARAAASRSL